MGRCQPLHAFPDGSRVLIRKLCSCPNARGRLCALGLTPGTTVVVGCRSGSGCRVLVRGAWVVLDQRLASAVMGCPSQT